jgi:hypothetical protein
LLLLEFTTLDAPSADDEHMAPKRGAFLGVLIPLVAGGKPYSIVAQLYPM